MLQIPVELLLAQVGPRKTSCCVPLASTLMTTPRSQERLTGLNLFLGLHKYLTSSMLRTSSCPYYYPLHCRQVQLRLAWSPADFISQHIHHPER